MLENHQNDHDLRGHGDFRIAFHSHDIVIIIVTQICYSSSLLFLSVRRCTTSIKEAHFPFHVQLACLSCNLSHSVCLASSKTKGEASLFLSSASVFSFSSLPRQETSGFYYPCVSSLFHPFIISPQVHVVVSAPVCFPLVQPTFERGMACYCG